MSSTSRTQSPLLRLPVELQMEFLGYLQPRDQLTAAAAYPLWNDIIRNRASFKRNRYSIPDAWEWPCDPKTVTGFGFHRLITFPHEGIGLSQKHFCFLMQRGALKKWACRTMETDGPMMSKRKSNGRSRKSEKWRDINECFFLDEPVLSPYDVVPFFEDDDASSNEASSINLPTGDGDPGRDGLPLIGRAYRNPRPWDMYTPYEQYIEPALEYKSPIWATVRITGDGGMIHSCHDPWMGQLYVRRRTTVRQILDAIIQEIEPLLSKEMGVDTRIPREICFVADKVRSRWEITATVVFRSRDYKY
ncbi:hypothetical protein ABW21_db0202649 [Orbilia brochopaga]|nr:hypothetical protein ABW21_db0202649 [Drechslerella brochopaga]